MPPNIESAWYCRIIQTTSKNRVVLGKKFLIEQVLNSHNYPPDFIGEKDEDSENWEFTQLGDTFKIRIQVSLTLKPLDFLPCYVLVTWITCCNCIIYIIRQCIHCISYTLYLPNLSNLFT